MQGTSPAAENSPGYLSSWDRSPAPDKDRSRAGSWPHASATVWDVSHRAHGCSQTGPKELTTATAALGRSSYTQAPQQSSASRDREETRLGMQRVPAAQDWLLCSGGPHVPDCNLPLDGAEVTGAAQGNRKDTLSVTHSPAQPPQQPRCLPTLLPSAHFTDLLPQTPRWGPLRRER